MRKLLPKLGSVRRNNSKLLATYVISSYYKGVCSCHAIEHTTQCSVPEALTVLEERGEI